MPQPIISDIRLNDIISCLKPMVNTLRDIHDSFGSPFVLPIISTTTSLIDLVPGVKRNRNSCIQLMEDVNQVLYGIVARYIASEAAGALPPAVLKEVATFIKTLHEIHAFTEAQREGNKLSHFFHQGQINTLLKNCRSGMAQALAVFKIENSTTINDMGAMQHAAEEMHKKLLETLSDPSLDTLSDATSTASLHLRSAQQSSSSFTMLPSRPKIFHGREAELEQVMKLLTDDSAHVAILGAGGMGKTTLARAVLHRPEVSAKFDRIIFVSAESASNSAELASTIAQHLGLGAGRNTTRMIVDHLSDTSSLLVLDNLESVWEPIETRNQVEELLSLLSEIKSLALMITMRGAERPAKVAWTRPFLQPLRPLPEAAALQTFIDIADDAHDADDLRKILSLTDNMPLAVSLIAHLVDYEGCSTILDRWEVEKTSILSSGTERTSNLDLSIAMSLTSPRLSSAPDAQNLLSLLSILPDGLSDVDLVQSNLPISGILRCKSILLETSLAYSENKRLKVLVPIREYMRKLHPPPMSLFHPLQQHLHHLILLFQQHGGIDRGAILGQITGNLGNLTQLLLQELRAGNTEHAVACMLGANNFYNVHGHGGESLMNMIAPILDSLNNPRLQVEFIIEQLYRAVDATIDNPEERIHQAEKFSRHLRDPELEVSLYTAAAAFYFNFTNDATTTSQNRKYLQKALNASEACQDMNWRIKTLNALARDEWSRGNSREARVHASQAARLGRLHGNLYEEGRALTIDGLCCGSMGDYQNALGLSRRAEDTFTLCGMYDSTMNYINMENRAEIHLLKSEYREAEQIYLEIMRRTSRTRYPVTHAGGNLYIAHVRVFTGAPEVSIRETLDEAHLILDNHSHVMGLQQCKQVYALLDLREGRTESARSQFLQCFDSTLIRRPETACYCLEWLADVRRWGALDSQPDLSIWPVVYLAYASKFKRRMDIAKALLRLADLYYLWGDKNTGYNLFLTSLEEFTWMDVHSGRAHCFMRLGDIAIADGDINGAIELWSSARGLFEKSLGSREVDEIDRKLRSIQGAATSG